MAETPEQRWARDLAVRLRMIQTSWSDDNEGARRETLKREVRKALDAVPSVERKARLDALRQLFPSWNETSIEVVEKVRDGPPRALSLKELVAELKAIAARMGPNERQRVAAELQQAGIELPPVSPAPDLTIPDRFEMPPETTTLLGLQKAPTVEHDRVFHALHEVLDCLITLADLAADIRAEFCARASLDGQQQCVRPMPQAGKLAECLRGYFQGDPDCGPEDVRNEIDATRAGLVAFVVSPQKIGTDLLPELGRLLDPAKIEKAVGGGGPLSALTNRKADCWDRFCRLWRTRGYQAGPDDSPFWRQDYADLVVKFLWEPDRRL